MESIKKEYNFQSQTGLPTKILMYDREEKSIYEYVVSNDDYTGKIENLSMITRIDGIAFSKKIEVFELLEANKQGMLKGKLKEIADGLNEDDNPVIMLVKHKK